jgi:hypothetical protein
VRREKARAARALLLLLLTVALTSYGCSSRSEWEHRQYPRPLTDAGRERLARDRYECERETYSDPRLTRLCLESRGWSQVRNESIR